MPSKSRKLSPAEIGAFEASRDIGAEILQSIKDMKAGKEGVVALGSRRSNEANDSSEALTLACFTLGLGNAQAEEHTRSDPEISL